jgi:hypothetical protein
MKIYFKQSGGLLGIDDHILINSDSLHPEEAAKLERLIDDAQFFNLPSQSAPQEHGADYFEYKVTIEAEKLKHSIKTTDITMPSNLGPLIRYLRQKAQKEKRNRATHK